ncbi:uncharacterized protein LOC117174617 [Belonocnema kinseyi]|uniref:uncharacterized protein LOC117174617 n=1 Tax=Belonocnema kinseyi TaxID=2817044 RepID=UPI00143D29D9|nr:uncharacterized protein LOC117174617 [Belonocnema kinseyi]
MNGLPFWSLLIVCGILSQGIVVLSVENVETSSDLLSRQKRSTRLARPELIRSHQQHQSFGQPMIATHQQHQAFSQLINRTPLQQLEAPSAVSIRIHGVRVGLGIVIHSYIIATKASYFRNTSLARTSVTFFSPTRRDYERRRIVHIEECRGIPTEPLAPHNVALVVVNERIFVHEGADMRLRDNFTPSEIRWIRSKVLSMIPHLTEYNLH